MKIRVPRGAELLKHDNGFRIRGTADLIIEFSNQIRRLKDLPIGGFAKFDELELTVANYPSGYTKRIAIPADA